MPGCVKGDKSTATLTCVPPGNGVRIALDRDEDGYFDGDERRADIDPVDLLSLPEI